VCSSDLGKGWGILFKQGVRVKTAPYEALADELADLIRGDGIAL